MTLWELNIKIGEELEKLYKLDKDKQDALFLEQWGKYRRLKTIFLSYKARSNKKMTRREQQNIIVSENI